MNIDLIVITALIVLLVLIVIFVLGLVAGIRLTHPRNMY